MKRLSHFIFGLALTASAAHAQTYLIKQNGSVWNIDRLGQVYDRIQFILPYQIRFSGGMFYAKTDGTLTTVDENGFFYRHERNQVLAPKKILFKGFNYFVEPDGTPWSIDRQGVYTQGEPLIPLKAPRVKGGIFFTVAPTNIAPARFYVVTDRGYVVETPVADLDLSTIEVVGGNWFTTKKGVLYTVSREGFVYNKLGSVPRIPEPEFTGGTFFVVNNRIVTISDEGTATDKGSMTTFGKIAKVGWNYFVTQDKKLFTIDHKGVITNRTGRLDFSTVGITTF